MTKEKEKSILFVCTGNACRSQMAEGFARSILPKSWKVYSAGVMAAGVHPMTIETMREAGIDIRDQFSKMIDDIPIREIDHVVTLCGSARDRCPVFPGAVAKEHWPIEDPLGEADRAEAFKKCREDIRRRMEDLAERIDGRHHKKTPA